MTVSRIVRTSGSVPEDRKVRLIQTYLVICHLASGRKKTVSMFQDISYIKIHVKSDEILTPAALATSSAVNPKATISVV